MIFLWKENILFPAIDGIKNASASSQHIFPRANFFTLLFYVGLSFCGSDLRSGFPGERKRALRLHLALGLFIPLSCLSLVDLGPSPPVRCPSVTHMPVLSKYILNELENVWRN